MHQHADHDHGECGGHGADATFFARHHHLLLPAFSGAFLLAGWLIELSQGSGGTLSWILYAGAYLTGGWEVMDSSLKGLLKFRFDIDLLMLIAGIGAALIGLYAEGALLFFLFSLGHGLEHHAMGQARKAIRSLGEMTPRTALLIDGTEERIVDIETLAIGDLVRVRPGSKVPVDGRILEGRSTIDQSAITGESVPVERGPDQGVYAGSLNGNAALAVRVERLADDSTMARMVKLVEEGRRQRGRSQRLTETFTLIYVPVILIGVILLILLPPAFGLLTFKDSFLRGMTVLVAASPCALAISTPSAILAGIAQAARNGVLVKGGAHLENLGTIKVLAMDKTGTITTGRPELTDVLPVGDIEESELLRLVGAVESQSTHPLARSISRACRARQLEVPVASDVRNLPGIGLEARVDEHRILVGGERLLDESASEDATGCETARRLLGELRASARTTMVAIRDGAVLGVIGLQDRPRANAASMIERLHRLGIRAVVMLTGDNEPVARRVAEEVGIDSFESDLMPEDKIRLVRELGRTHRSVGMVGDGVNDAPALAAANVGIAMGGGGTDVALETADVALMADDLCRLPFAIGLSRRVRRTILQNLLISMGVIGALVPVAALGLAPIWLAVVFHEGSTLVVVLNALRLLVYRDRTN